MHIVFSCTAEGFGHAARLVAMAEDVRWHHRVTAFAPAGIHRFITNHLPDIAIHEIPCFTLRKEGARIRYLGTLVDNTGLMARFSSEVQRIAEVLRELEADAVVSDYDPFTAHAAAALNLPVVQINHPAVVLKDTSNHPAAVAARALAPFLMGPHDHRIISSFYLGDVGPIIRRDLLEAPHSTEDYLLVYAKDSYRELICDALHQAGVTRYRLYPDAQGDYPADFAGCRGVISSAGHQIISEAIVLGKPALVLPQAGQYEQELNARMLVRSGRGDVAREATLHRDLRRFLLNLERYPLPQDPAIPFSFTDHRVCAVKKILSLLERHTSERYSIGTTGADGPGTGQSDPCQDQAGVVPSKAKGVGQRVGH